LSKNNNTSAKNKKDVIDKITDWLGQEGISFNLTEDPYADFNLEIEYPTTQVIHIMMYKNKNDSITVITKVSFSTLDKKAFTSLSEDIKKDFILTLNSSLSSMNLLYSHQPNPERMEHLLIQKRLFFDGLTKDRFFDILDRIYNGMNLANWTYTKYLSKGKNSLSSLSSFFF
jgi:hypothetical protein